MSSEEGTPRVRYTSSRVRSRRRIVVDASVPPSIIAELDPWNILGTKWFDVTLEDIVYMWSCQTDTTMNGISVHKTH